MGNQIAHQNLNRTNWPEFSHKNESKQGREKKGRGTKNLKNKSFITIIYWLDVNMQHYLLYTRQAMINNVHRL